MHWFLDPIQNHYADFTGRTTRQAFWMYILLYIIIYIVVSIVGAIIGMEWLALVFSLAFLIPGWAITARRLHDIGKSGWWQLISIIPLIGLVVMIYLLVQDSEPGANKFGQNPKDAAGGMPDAGMPMAQTAAPAAESMAPQSAPEDQQMASSDEQKPMV